MAPSIFRNIGLKLAALGLGVLLWVTVSGQQVERNVLVQLQFRNIPASLELTGDTPRTVDVRVRGAAGLISALEPYQVAATIDLTDARPGVRVFPLTIDQISVPLGVEVKSADPSTVSLTLERSATARVRVKPTIDGDPAPGYEVSEMTWQPEQVDVTGPESHLKDLPAAVTERISIEGLTTSVADTVNLGVTDASVRLKQAQTARVSITIVPGPTARFPNRPISFDGLAQGRHATAQPQLAGISLRASRQILNSLGLDQLRPFVDVAGLGAGTYALRVRVTPPPGSVIVAIDPATVSVRIQ